MHYNHGLFQEQQKFLKVATLHPPFYLVYWFVSTFGGF